MKLKKEISEADYNELYELCESYRRELGEVRAALNDAHRELKIAVVENEKLKKQNTPSARAIPPTFIADIEELLQASVKIEGIRADSADRYLTRQIHRYAESLCETLLSDLQKIERKYTNG